MWMKSWGILFKSADQNVSSNDRDFFPDPEICLVEVTILEAWVGDGRIGLRFEIVD
jgi:hypothetical protein